ncbi:hypothetical protein L580_1857 [Serratia fonticola AU-P3(3)]|nr:hypothetical protein L580_1857 [Serratia fonticola AU-P3(3)]
MRLIATQEALAVHHALVFAIQPSVNEIRHTSPKQRCQLSLPWVFQDVAVRLQPEILRYRLSMTSAVVGL